MIVVAEGLAEYLPHKYLDGVPRDDHGHISVATVNLGKMLAKTGFGCLQSQDWQNLAK